MMVALSPTSVAKAMAGSMVRTITNAKSTDTDLLRCFFIDCPPSIFLYKRSARMGAETLIELIVF